MQAKTLYEALVSAIDKACDSRGFFEVCDSAAKFGMSGGEVKAFNRLKYEFAYTDSEGGSVVLNVRSYDPSGPFQNEPDINRFTARLMINGHEIASHDRSYED